MTARKILLLDIGSSSDSTQALQKLLEDSLPAQTRVACALIRPNAESRLTAELEETLRESAPDLLLIVLGEAIQARGLVARAHAQLPGLPIIILSDIQEPDIILSLLREGAADFITPPYSSVDLITRVRRALEFESEEQTANIKATLGLRQLVGHNQAFVAEITKIPIIARCDATVLITGETGTGKELCARAIHYLSARAKCPFIPVNCGAIPSELAENELFGHERGAYTGAASSQIGLIEEANGGTLFLDEIDCLSPLTQVKLLRFLQDKEYRPLGSPKARRADVRIIAATNTDIEQSVREGRLRQDLYYRLHVIPFVLLPLRERTDDIPLLADHFLNLYSTILKKSINEISTEALSKLMIYQWPGNVRELEHVIERAVVMCHAAVLTESDIVLSRFEQTEAGCSFQEGKARAVSQFERNYIRGLLLTHRRHIARAAKAANKNRRAFWELIRKHRIDVSIFKPGAQH